MKRHLHEDWQEGPKIKKEKIKKVLSKNTKAKNIKHGIDMYFDKNNYNNLDEDYNLPDDILYH